MAQYLSELSIGEVSLVDRPANSEVDPITGQKVARARVALFKRDTTEAFVKAVEGRTKKVEGETMTLEQIEKKLTDQEAVLKGITDENAALKAENAAVLKMSRDERSAYASMSEELRKEFTAADDDKKKAMMATADKEAKCKAAEDSMDDATCKRYKEAGPVEKAAILQPFLDKIEKAEKVAKKKPVPPPPPPAEGSPDEEAAESPDEEAAEGDDGENMALKRELAATVDRINKAERDLNTIKKAQRLEVFTKQAETELPHTTGTPVEKGEMLMTLADTLPGGESGEAFTKIMKSLKAADSAVSIHFTEVGKHGGGGVPSLKVFEAKVEEISKRDKVSVSKATETAMMESPDLYLAYEKDQRQLALQR